MDDPDETRPPRPPELSKTPSWVMLGFVLGALVVLAMPRTEKKAAPPPVAVVAPPAPVAPQPLTVERAVFFEDVFAELNRSAVWQDDVTEVAFWNATRRAFSDCYEVLKVGDKFYFRSIPHLTRPVMTEGVPPDSPIRFTVPAGVSIPIAPVYGIKTQRDPEPMLMTKTTRPASVTAPPVVPVEKPPVELPQTDGK